MFSIHWWYMRQHQQQLSFVFQEKISSLYSCFCTKWSNCCVSTKRRVSIAVGLHFPNNLDLNLEEKILWVISSNLHSRTNLYSRKIAYCHIVKVVCCFVVGSFVAVCQQYWCYHFHWIRRLLLQQLVAFLLPETSFYDWWNIILWDWEIWWHSKQKRQKTSYVLALCYYHPHGSA